MTGKISRDAITHAKRFLQRGWMGRAESGSDAFRWQRELIASGYMRRERSELHFTEAGRAALSEKQQEPKDG